ncbi:Rrf2 family transcriptional regulator [Acidisphaera sp. L21]|uniref:Rrf2 family transcriptional regulator n=1 Tax=Acidisphaera sp. L21 TaxID=1641851 RepID=UPI0020B12E78|nr:Rrf2 family transcriptional regulator [Acidisphaera sp. L21]
MVPTRFAVAAHILLMVATDSGEASTSQRLASSINTNPVVIRRITGQLARAGLVRVRRGPGGAELTRAAGAITLEDVWLAVNSGSARPLLPLHANPDPRCPVGCRVHAVLGEAFGTAERALEHALARTTLEDLLQGVAEPAA